MFTFCGPVLSFIMFTLGGIYLGSFGGVATNTPSPRPILVQTVEYKPDECAPSRLSGLYTHDIACVLETFDAFLYNQDFETIKFFECAKISLRNSLAGLHRTLVEVLSEFEQTELITDQTFNESLCMLKEVIVVGLDKTVRDYCSCKSQENCSLVPTQVSEISGDGLGYTNDKCTLLSLRATLKRIQIILGGEEETCRRASSAQQQILMDFMENIQTQYEVVAPPVSEILGMIRLPGSLCHYRGPQIDLNLHVESLHMLIPYLSTLNSTEAQHLSENLSEVVFPVIEQLMVKLFSEAHIERLLNSSVPFSKSTEATLASLNEQEKSICLIGRLSVIYSRFMGTLKHRNVNVISDLLCIQNSN